MKRTLMATFIVISLGLTVFAQEKAKEAAAKNTALPSADQILDKFVNAVGGKQAFEKYNTRVLKGTMDIDAMNISGTLEVYSKAPNKTVSTVSLPGVGDFTQIFDGEKGWSNNPMEGLRELAGNELAAFKRRSDFYSELNMKKNYTKFEVKGKDKVGSEDVYLVEATAPEGGVEKLYFAVESGLLLRHDFEAESPQGKLATETYMEEYKEMDGIKVPYMTRQVNPMFAVKIKLAEIKHNVPIEDAKFNKPN